MSVVFRYRAYDLLVSSELALPELPPWEGEHHPPAGRQVCIRLGRPHDSSERRIDDSELDVRPGSFTLSIEGVARYHVNDGSDIVIEPVPGASDHDVRVYLLGSCFGGLLHQRGALVMHASAIADDAGAILFCGHSGIGKSSLLGELLRRGHRMLVDDVCALNVDADGRVVAHSAYPRTRLWADTAEVLGQPLHGLQRTAPDMDKYEHQVPDHFWSASARVRHVFLLGRDTPDALHVEPLAAIGRFTALLEHTYRREFLGTLPMQERHFELAAAVARTVPVTRVIRPIAPFRLTELADLVEQELGLTVPNSPRPVATGELPSS